MYYLLIMNNSSTLCERWTLYDTDIDVESSVVLMFGFISFLALKVFFNCSTHKSSYNISLQFLTEYEAVIAKVVIVISANSHKRSISSERVAVISPNCM